MPSRRTARTGPPRRRHRGRNWLIALLVLAALLVAADRITLVVAERVAASTIRNHQHLDSTPSVHVRGFPFLTQVLSGTFDGVDVTAKDILAGQGSRTIRIAQLSAHLQHVHVSGFSSARADSVTASALISYSALTGTLGVPIRYGGSTADGLGRVAASTSVSALGQQISGTASAEISISAGNVLTFVNLRAIVAGAPVPQAVLSALSGVFVQPLALQRLPFGLTVRSVRAGPSGVTIVATGTDVTYQ